MAISPFSAGPVIGPSYPWMNSVLVAGAVGDGVTDDSTAIQNVLNAASTAGGGTVFLPPGYNFFVGSSLTIPAHVSLVGNVVPGDRTIGTATVTMAPQLFLGGTTSITVSQYGSISGIAVIRNGLNLAPGSMRGILNAINGFTGTAIVFPNPSDSCRVERCFIAGHALGISTSFSARFLMRDLLIDCTAGVTIDNMHDVSLLDNVVCYSALTPGFDGAATPSWTITGTASDGGLIKVAFTSTTNTFVTGDVVWITGVVGTTEANGKWTITVIDSTHIDLQGSTFTNAWVSGGTIYIDLTHRSGTAFAVTNSEAPTFIKCFSYGHQTAYDISTAAGWVNLLGCGCDGFATAKDPTTTAINIENSSYGATIVGGFTLSHATAVACSATGPNAIQHTVTGMAINSNGNGPVVNVTSGRIFFNSCNSTSTGTVSLGPGISRVGFANCEFKASTPSFSGPTGTTMVSSTYIGPTGYWMGDLPKVDPHVVGQWWSNAGVVTVSAG